MFSENQKPLAEAMLSDFEQAVAAYKAAMGPAQNECLARFTTIMEGKDAQARHDLLHEEADDQFAEAEEKAVAALSAIYADENQCREEARKTDAYRAAELRHDGISSNGLRVAESAIEVLKIGLGRSLTN